MLKDYFDEKSEDLNRKSEQLRKFFATHAPSSGSNRESLVADLIKDYIIPRAGIGAGLIISATGQFSNQSDVVIYDPVSNGPLFRSSPIPIWLLESVYGVIEVKTQLTPTTLKDSIKKCRNFKGLQTNYDKSADGQKIKDHLFIIWSFEAPSNETAKRNIEAELSNVPHQEQPDFIIVPGRFIAQGGQYYSLAKNGQPGSEHYRRRLLEVGGDTSKLLVEQFEMMDLGKNTLSAMMIWLNSWIYEAGSRRPNIISYYGDMIWGTKVL